MQTVLITGGTGLVGKALTLHLSQKGYNVIILTRSIKESNLSSDKISYAVWDVKKKIIDIAAVQKADFIIHLAGAGVVDKRWTEKYKQEIQDSRVKSAELIIDTLKNHPHSVKAIISASGIGWYGPDPDAGFNGFKETDKAYSDFLAQTCVLWEKSIEPAEALGIRVVKLRTGIVLSKDGGAFPEFKKTLQFGIASILGSGKQMVSWLHIEDLCRLYTYAIENSLEGSYNAVTSSPVSNKQLILQIAAQLRGKFFIPMHVPGFILKIVLGGSSIEVLKSTTVNNEKIKATGFIFLYPTIEAALKELGKK